jgi:membrane fusion protein, multidrug efflux system
MHARWQPAVRFLRANWGAATFSPESFNNNFLMASKLIYSVVAVLGIAGASGAAWWYQNQPKTDNSANSAGASPGSQGAAPAPAVAASGPRPAAVEVSKVEIIKLIDEAQAVGNLRSRQSVMLRPEVSGRVSQLNFRDGERVKKGQLLVQFDDQLPLAQVKQSQAELSIALANHKRNQDLVEQNFISKRSVEESAANLEVAQAKLALAVATAARMKVLAPFDGIAGIRAVSQGDYLKDGADIVNIEDIDAVYVDFRLPERFQSKVKKGQRAMVDLDALPGRKFSALIQAIDPLLDANGRSVSVRGCIDNRQMQLRPGMFARVTTVFGERERARVIPEEAIVPQGPRLFVIKLVDGPEPGSKVSQRVEVKVGIRRPGKVEIMEGLSDDDTVVIAGQQRLQKDGSVVRVIDMNKPRTDGVATAPAGSASAAVGAAPVPAGTAPMPATTASLAGALAGAIPAPGKPGGKPPAPGQAPAKAGEGPDPCQQDLSLAKR